MLNKTLLLSSPSPPLEDRMDLLLGPPLCMETTSIAAQSNLFSIYKSTCACSGHQNHWLFILTSVGISQNTFKLTLWPFPKQVFHT